MEPAYCMGLPGVIKNEHRSGNTNYWDLFKLPKYAKT